MNGGRAPLTARDAIETEVEEAEQNLCTSRRAYDDLLDLRHTRLPPVAEHYLRGVRDGLSLAEKEVEGITRYPPTNYNLTLIPDPDIRDDLRSAVSEAREGNLVAFAHTLQRLGDEVEAQVKRGEHEDQEAGDE